MSDPIKEDRDAGHSITLQSNGLVSTPGFIQYVGRAFNTGDQEDAFDLLLATFPTLPLWAAMKIKEGTYVIDQDNNTVTIKQWA